MILLTGAAGFIASAYLRQLNAQGFRDIVLVDDFSRLDKKQNWRGTAYRELVQREDLALWLAAEKPLISACIHLGARTDTREQDLDLLDRLNLDYSKMLFRYCSQRAIPFIYASSAATYGGGEQGYSDNIVPQDLEPLNPYGRSKNDFDAWVLAQEQCPPFWAGLKFFNVYGLGEFHKQGMASVIWHAYKQIQTSGMMRLFRSHKLGIADGEQKRDFIHVDDVLSIIEFLRKEKPSSGIYNVGTGQARSFKDLALACFAALQIPAHIEYMDTPLSIREAYQYFTEADMSSLRTLGYQKSFRSLEEGAAIYIRQLLSLGV